MNLHRPAAVVNLHTHLHVGVQGVGGVSPLRSHSLLLLPPQCRILCTFFQCFTFVVRVRGFLLRVVKERAEKRSANALKRAVNRLSTFYS